MSRLAAVVCVFALTVVACSNADDTDSVRVFAASSLTDVLVDVGAAFEESGTQVDFNFAGSSALREQILDGAAADVFISANRSVMAELIEADDLAREPVPIAENTMEIAVPIDNDTGVSGLADLADASLAVGLCAEGVPCGDLASEVLDAAGIEPSVDTYEPNVRALLSKVELGELDAALVYRTDILASDEAVGVGLDPGTGGRSSYLAVTLADTGEASELSGAAQAFVNFLTSAPAQRLFVDAGFDTP
jgi:molybdate transport system substrate-binding protein